jgi:hypothetical protein
MFEQYGLVQVFGESLAKEYHMTRAGDSELQPGQERVKHRFCGFFKRFSKLLK